MILQIDLLIGVLRHIYSISAIYIKWWDHWLCTEINVHAANCTIFIKIKTIWKNYFEQFIIQKPGCTYHSWYFSSAMGTIILLLEYDNVSRTINSEQI